MASLVPVLPLLCIVAIVLKIAFRTQPPRVRYALVSYLSTLLVVSGVLATVATVLVVSFVPIPAIVNNGLPSLDEQTDFPLLASADALSSADVSSRLKPLVIVVSPAVRLWNGQEIASQSFGAGVLLEAAQSGYLFATANHVANHGPLRNGSPPPHVMIATAAGVWSNAEVVAIAAPQDLALLWVPRHSGSARFVQPIAEATDGEDVFVIGHPEGLKYSLSTGIVSGLREEAIQISAAISPGNSGGPVYDSHGQLIGIVSSKFDHTRDANAENLGFAVRAQLLRDAARWSFYGSGRQRLEAYVDDLQKTQSVSPMTGKLGTKTGKE
ncbi:S1C family serine protease [Edaphobacter aggregans]|uniref:S1C family serine protease n=1 Tax=Edaphobacter aggregans TaxID=570835 RepID=UPI00146FDB74|nr:serine protease [Edaphobacter aggregans]